MTKVSFSPIHTELHNNFDKPKKYNEIQVDMNELYNKKEIDDIVSSFDCLHKTTPMSSQECAFDVVYLPTKNAIVINNRNLTNDTVEIDQNGKAVSVGSWHRKELDGDYSVLVNSVKSRYEQTQNNNKNKLTEQLDSMAQLGKSQVK